MAFAPAGFNIKCDNCKTEHAVACIAEYHVLLFLLISMGVGGFVLLFFGNKYNLLLIGPNIRLFVLMVSCSVISVAFFHLPYLIGYLKLYKTKCGSCGKNIKQFRFLK